MVLWSFDITFIIKNNIQAFLNSAYFHKTDAIFLELSFFNVIREHLISNMDILYFNWLSRQGYVEMNRVVELFTWLFDRGSLSFESLTSLKRICTWSGVRLFNKFIYLFIYLFIGLFFKIYDFLISIDLHLPCLK